MLFDDIDTLCPKRETSHNEVEKRVVVSLIRQMDDLVSHCTFLAILSSLCVSVRHLQITHVSSTDQKRKACCGDWHDEQKGWHWQCFASAWSVWSRNWNRSSLSRSTCWGVRRQKSMIFVLKRKKSVGPNFSFADFDMHSSKTLSHSVVGANFRSRGKGSWFRRSWCDCGLQRRCVPAWMSSF